MKQFFEGRPSWEKRVQARVFGRVLERSFKKVVDFIKYNSKLESWISNDPYLAWADQELDRQEEIERPNK